MSKKASKYLIGGFLIFGLLLAGMRTFSGKTSSTNVSADGDSAASGYNVKDSAQAPSAQAQKTAAPAFTLRTLAGEIISLADYKDHKPVILDFWASWCHNCQRAFPKTAKLYEQYKGDVEIIGVNMRESSSVAQNFVNKANAGFPNGIDSGSISQQYGIRYTNTHVLIDREGNIVNSFSGDLNESHIKSLISL